MLTETLTMFIILNIFFPTLLKSDILFKFVKTRGLQQI